MDKMITLPSKPDGTHESVVRNRRPIIIIGANGSGKSRFTDRLIADLGASAFRMSALNALYRRHQPDAQPGSIDMLYDDATARSPFMRSDNVTQFERLLALMLHDEVLSLIDHKIASASGNMLPLPESRIDKVVQAWQEIFPDSRVLREGGRLLFSRELSSEAYSSVKLSDGEKAVFYYFGAALYAPDNAVVFVDSPGIFLHPTVISPIWDRVEAMRPDCTFVYTTHDIEFAASRRSESVIWVRRYDAANTTWDYAVLPPGKGLSDELYLTLVGARKPVLFIEGDEKHSIDSKLYPLIFTDYTVKSLGSCNKVIEATRTFNDLTAFHHLDSYGIVDRDRRDAGEVKYLRDKKIFVPDVAEIENILMLEEVIRTVAHRHGRDENRVFDKVKKSIIAQFRHDIRQQALLHTRHRVKRTMEYRIDGRFTNINQLEQHMQALIAEINARGMFERFCRDFHIYADTGDYQSVLRVYNQKSMLPGSNVAALCGLSGKDAYIRDIINILKENGRDAARIRRAVTHCFGIDEATAAAPLPSLPNSIEDIDND